MSRHNLKEKFKTSVGGQALIEGVMMRGPSKLAIAVRDPAGEIQVETNDVKPNPVAQIPILRGVVSFIDSLLVGYKAIMRSAEISMTEEEKEEEQSGFDRWLEEHLGEKGMGVLMTVSALAGGLLAIVLFMVLPTFFTRASRPLCGAGRVQGGGGGGGKAGALCALPLFDLAHERDQPRLFRYHGAEHKTIATYEAGEPLTVENVRGNSRFHPRCGTCFCCWCSSSASWCSALCPGIPRWGGVGLKLLLLPAGDGAQL